MQLGSGLKCPLDVECGSESIFEMIDGSQQQQWVSHIELAVMVDDYWVQQWVYQTLKIEAGAMVENYWVQKWVCHT